MLSTFGLRREQVQSQSPRDRCPANAVTPVASRLSLTTKSEAMKSNAGSPKPSEGRIQVGATGRRSATNTTATAAGTRKVMVEWLTAVRALRLERRPR
jgi:hypothetical protein